MQKRLEEMTEPELSQLMSTMARMLDGHLRKFVKADTRPQFVLVVFDDPKVAQYVSSCERASMIEAMRETADRLERNEDVPR